MAFLVAILISVLLVYIFSFHDSIRKWLKFRKYAAKIPGPPMHPILGNFSSFNGKNTAEMIDMLLETASEGRKRGENVMRFQLFGKMYVWPLNGKTAAKILDSTTELRKGEDYRFLDPWVGGGLVLLDGDQKWKSHRKLLTPTFHFAKLERYFEVFDSNSKILIQCLEECLEETFNIQPFLKRCTLDTICEAAMGKKLNSQFNKDVEYLKAVEGLNHLTTYYSITPALWNPLVWKLSGYQKKFENYLKTMKDFTLEVLRERRSAYASGDVDKEESKRMMNFLDLLLSMEESNEWTENEIREEVDTFMFAGHDTTTASTSWLCWNLAHNPEIQEKCYKEIVGIFGEDLNSEVTLEGVNKLEYTERVIKESKRMRPPIPAMMRQLKEDMIIDGSVVPAGSNVCIGPVVLHANPEAFENPLTFNPDRFLPEEISKRHAYDFVPFSAGLRNCIGQRFAQLNEKVIISHILRNYKLTADLGFFETKQTFEVVSRPTQGIPVKLTKREYNS